MYNYKAYLRSILKGIPCILAYGTASEYLGLGLFEGYLDYNEIEVFVEKENKDLIRIGKEENIKIIQYVIDNFDNKDYINLRGLLVTTENQTIIDLIEQDEDIQNIQITLSSYYYLHNQSFNDLIIPDYLLDKFNIYCEWALEYYND